MHCAPTCKQRAVVCRSPERARSVLRNQLEVQVASILRRHSSKLGHDPNLPHIPMGESKNEIFYIIAAIAILAIIAFSFWFEAWR